MEIIIIISYITYWKFIEFQINLFYYHTEVFDLKEFVVYPSRDIIQVLVIVCSTYDETY